MAGRKPIFDREEHRKNQVVVPMSEQEKGLMFIPEFVCGILATIGVEFLLLVVYTIFRKK